MHTHYQVTEVVSLILTIGKVNKHSSYVPMLMGFSMDKYFKRVDLLSVLK
jgi:hypothetical protein